MLHGAYAVVQAWHDREEPILSLSAANKTGIDISGAVYLEIAGKDKSGKLWKTTQLCYVA